MKMNENLTADYSNGTVGRQEKTGYTILLGNNYMSFRLFLSLYAFDTIEFLLATNNKL